MEAEFSDPSKADSISSSTVASEDEGFLDLDYTPSNLNEIGSDVLDSLQLVVEKSRNYFDQEYGAKGANRNRDIIPPLCFSACALVFWLNILGDFASTFR